LEVSVIHTISEQANLDILLLSMNDMKYSTQME